MVSVVPMSTPIEVRNTGATCAPASSPRVSVSGDAVQSSVECMRVSAFDCLSLAGRDLIVLYACTLGSVKIEESALGKPR
jgi:hypothetical protein